MREAALTRNRVPCLVPVEWDRIMVIEVEAAFHCPWCGLTHARYMPMICFLEYRKWVWAHGTEELRKAMKRMERSSIMPELKEEEQ